MVPLHRQYEEARFKLDIKIFASLYMLKQPKTLEDIYHNLEVLRKITHERIDSEFILYRLQNNFHNYGYCLIDRGMEVRQYNDYIIAIDPIA